MSFNKALLNIDGLCVTYYVIGQGKPLLFLHGGRVRALTFKKTLEELSKDYMVIAPDIPGYGDSSTPDKVWSYEDYGKYFNTFLKELNLKNVTVVGYSMGGGIALNLAGHSSLVKRLVLVDSAGTGLKPKSKHLLGDIRRLFFYVSHPQYLAILATLLRSYLQFTRKHSHDRQHINKIRKHCSQKDYEQVIKNIKVPTKVLWAEGDKDIPIAQSKKLLRLIEGSSITTVKGNHDWPLYSPLLLRKMVL
jgi:pimeloyl-ACP methyl ester carboxylesterase